MSQAQGSFKAQSGCENRQVALACPLCDVEERGGGAADRKTVSDALNKIRKED